MNWITLGIFLSVLIFESVDLIKAAHLTKSSSSSSSSGSNDDDGDYGNNNNDEKMEKKKSKLFVTVDDATPPDKSYNLWIYDSDANNKVDPDGEVIHLDGGSSSSQNERRGRKRSRQHHHHHHYRNDHNNNNQKDPILSTIDGDVTRNTNHLTAFLVDDTRIIEPESLGNDDDGDENNDDDSGDNDRDNDDNNHNNLPSNYKLFEESQSDFNHHNDGGVEDDNDDDDYVDDENEGSENLQKLMKTKEIGTAAARVKNKLSDNGWRSDDGDNKLLDSEGVGDMSCIEGDDFLPAPQIENADVKYLRNDMLGIENSYLEAEYHCHVGYKLVQASLSPSNFSSSGGGARRRSRRSKRRVTTASGGGKLHQRDYNKSDTITTIARNLICQSKKWHGLVPHCERLHHRKNVDKLCLANNKCEQICVLKSDNRTEQCSCFKGFKMAENYCIDVNECESSSCEHSCTNTVGSYRCKCKRGFELSGRHRCKDTNECNSRNGHGPCQDKCINLVGGYKCTCDGIPGTRLSADGHTCENVVDCSQNNGGCSHTCIDTLGNSFCSCPHGFTLADDWKTCTEINRDKSSNMESVCPKGYYFNYTYDECEDIDECAIQNAGCQDLCTNTEGNYYCSCQMGFIFGPDNKTCIEIANFTMDVTCPPLIPPDHGYLECSTNKHHIANWPGSQCVLRCPNGFRVIGRYSKICGNDGKWLGSGDGACIRYPKPKLICPNDVLVETPPRDSRVVMPMPRPKTDVSWDRDIQIIPNYVKGLSLVLSASVENITYTATHPISKLSVSCSFSITVLDGHAPLVKFCPETQKYTVAKHQDTIKVSWIEPIFADNINVTSVTKSNIPGNRLGMGTHLITYEARDAAGYTSRCTFKIIINGSRHQVLPLLYSKFYYL